MKILKSLGSGSIIKTAKFWAFAGLIITSVFITTCSDKKTIDFGEFEAGVYTNSFFDMMKLSRIKVSYPKEIYEMIIDGVTFDVMETEITMGPGAVIRQRQYATIMN